jgi:regulator of extracellular matrix RemA (YlzA/DUF370 family)
MFLHIGTNVMIRTNEMIAIIDRKGNDDKNKINKKFLEKIKDIGEIIDISDLETENAKSMVLVNNNVIYFSPISPQTLYKRSKNFGISEGLK